jgi:hypothetical protein
MVERNMCERREREARLVTAIMPRGAFTHLRSFALNRVRGDLPRKMFWRDKAGRGWYWESEYLGELPRT